MVEAVSIVVSSYNEAHYNRFRNNVRDTIGCEYEIIKIDNPGKYSLCEAYNLGIAKALYPYICFVHDDVEFLCSDWGAHCIDILKSDNRIGLIGVTGSAYKSTLPGSWWSTFTWNFCRGRICQGNNSYDVRRWDDFDKRTIKSDLSDVVCVDGVFMFTTQLITKQISFDAHTFTGYHCYDLDFSTSVFLKGYRVVVDRNILLFHYSQGNFDHIFAKYAVLYCRKYRTKLPLCAENILTITYLYIEIRSWVSYIKHKILRIV